MTTDRLTVLTSIDGCLATKVISRDAGQWHVRPYGSATWFNVRQIEVDGLPGLGRALRDLEGDPRDAHDCWLSGQPARHPERSFVIRGEPLPGINRARCRRLLYPHADPDTGEVTDPTFEAAPRRAMPIDFDALPVPTWNRDQLARRREAVLRIGDAFEHDDLDAAPIDPACDWPLIVRAAVSTLPPEFEHVHAWWQMTSSAGIKPGIRLRLWYWLDRPLSDEECRVWLRDCPVDLSIYRPVQPIYTAAPIFDPSELDPVPQRSGFWWRFLEAVPVPEIKVPVYEPPPAPERRPRTDREMTAVQRRARSYADACLRNAEQAPMGERHTTLRSAAITCFGLAEHGFVDHAEIRNDLIAITRRLRWREKRANDLISWCAAFAAAKRPLPRGFQ